MVSNPPNLGFVLVEVHGAILYAIRVLLTVAYELLNLRLSCRVVIRHKGVE